MYKSLDIHVCVSILCSQLHYLSLWLLQSLRKEVLNPDYNNINQVTTTTLVMVIHVHVWLYFQTVGRVLGCGWNV